MHEFKETHPELQGFSNYYHREILPSLAAADKRRKSSLVRAVLANIGVIIFMAVAAYFWHKGVKNTWADTLILAIPLSIFLMFWVSKRLLKKIKSNTKENLVGGICRFLGWHFSETPHITPDLDIWTRLRLLPVKYGRESFEDEMAGKVHGADFLAREVHLQKKKSFRIIISG